MLSFILNRLFQAVLVLLCVTGLASFMTYHAPGDPFSAERDIPAYIKEQLAEAYGLDEPWIVWHWNWLTSAVTGDLGPSYAQTRDVNTVIAQTLPVSLELGLWALLIALTLGVTAGIVAAVFRNTWLDYVPMSLAMGGICLPTFVLGPLLALFFGITLSWFNVAGWFGAGDRVLPALALGLFYAALIARITRGGMLEVLSEDYIRTAKAKGLAPVQVIVRHALKGGLLPVVTFLGPALAGIISGSFVIETIFQIPGLGRQFVTSAFNRDYTLVLGTVTIYSVFISLANLGVDVVQVLLNPRLRFEDS